MWDKPATQSREYGWPILTALIKNLVVVFIDDHFSNAPFAGYNNSMYLPLHQVRVLTDRLFLFAKTQHITPALLPRRQRRESMQGYVKRTIVNSMTQEEMLAKLFVLSADVLRTRSSDYLNFLCGTIAESIIINDPTTAEWLLRPLIDNGYHF